MDRARARGPDRSPAGTARRAAVLLSGASHLMEAKGAHWWPADRLEYRRNLEIIQSGLDPQEFKAAWDEGQRLTAEAAIEYTASIE